MRIWAIVAILILNGWSVSAKNVETSVGSISITKVIGGLDNAWGFAFLPDGGFLVTERGGRLTHVGIDGSTNRVQGAPRVVAKGQGGLLDVMIPRDFAQSRQVFLSFAKKGGGGIVTALAVAELSANRQNLKNLKVIFEMSVGTKSERHFGGRIVEARDGTIFLTIGERGNKPAAQNLALHNGSIIRIHRNGSIPGNNPFVDLPSARPEIWSYGHRNPQGAALDLKGQLWVNEHGAKGGDEINRILRGDNFGWPVIAYGRHYSGKKIGIGTHKPGMQQPAHFWDPSIAPSGLMIYSGKLWPKWRGSFFVGSLKFGYLARLDPRRGWQEEQIKSRDTGRLRDVREAPDGTIWFISVSEGAIFRMAPG